METDENVIFDNSALFAHLRDAGYSEEDISPETLSSVFEEVKESLEAGHTKAPETNKDELTDNNEQTPNRKLRFSFKRFISNVVFWFIGWNAWVTESKEHKQLFAFEAVDDILNTVILEHDDFEFLDKFYLSTKERYRFENDGIGEYFKHISIFIVVLGYGIARVIQIKSTGESGMESFAVDCVAVGLLVCVLLPSVVKIVAVEKTKLRLKSAKKQIFKQILELEKFHTLFKKSVRLIQEQEIVARGFTFSSQQTPLMRLEADDMTSRHYPALRRSIFHTSRAVLLHMRNETEKLLAIFSVNDYLEDAQSFLSLLPLAEYGPCVTIPHEDRARLAEVTDNYSIAAVKGMVQLCKAHVSEYIRLVALWCLLKHLNHTSNFFGAFEGLTETNGVIDFNVTRLEYSYLSHKSQLKTASKESVSRDKAPNEARGIYVAVHSLTLHLQAAHHRLQSVEKCIEAATDGESAISDVTETEWLSQLQIVKNELSACDDCWTESIKRIHKHKTHPGSTADADSGAEKSAPKKQEGDDSAEKAVREIGFPIIEDQVFEGYTDDIEETPSHADDDWVTEVERERRKEEKQEAVRMLRELRTVIATRSVETKKREKIALERMRGETTTSDDVTQEVTAEADGNSTSVERADDDSPGSESDLNIGLEQQDESHALKDTGHDLEELCESQEAINDDESEAKSTKAGSMAELQEQIRKGINAKLNLTPGLIATNEIAALAAARSREMFTPQHEETYADE